MSLKLNQQKKKEKKKKTHKIKF